MSEAMSESFTAAMERHGGFGEGEAPSEAAEGAESGEGGEGGEESALSPEDGAPGGAEPGESAESLVEQVKALAEKAGLKFDGASVTTAERAALRDARKRREQKWKQEEEERRSKWTQTETEKRTALERAERIQGALELGDYEEIARALEFENWEGLQGAVLAQNTDPNYKKMRELERWKNEQVQREKQQQEQQQKQQQEQQRTQAIRQYQQNLSKEMSESGDKLLSAMHDDAWFVGAVYQIQNQHWDPELSQTITPSEAVTWVDPKTGKSLRSQLEAARDRLNRGLGELEAMVSAGKKETPKQAQKTAKAAPKTGIVSSAEKSEASSAKQWSKDDDDEFFARARRRLSEATLEDIASQK